jgi:hypothetical protein
MASLMAAEGTMVKDFLKNLPLWTHKNTPKEFFLGMIGLITIGILIQATDVQSIPVLIVVALLPLAVFWGARMLYQNRTHTSFQLLAVATVVTVLISVWMGFSILASVGDPVGGDGDNVGVLYNQCADGDMAACDLLYWQSPVDSEAEMFGSTCGGRKTQVYGTCAGY